MRQSMAHITYWKKGKRVKEVVCTIEEARKLLTKKQFDRINADLGGFCGSISGYID